jgi:hypothetical protein
MRQEVKMTGKTVTLMVKLLRSVMVQVKMEVEVKMRAMLQLILKV